jgi:hypothetical protein
VGVLAGSVFVEAGTAAGEEADGWQAARKNIKTVIETTNLNFWGMVNLLLPNCVLAFFYFTQNKSCMIG